MYCDRERTVLESRTSLGEEWRSRYVGKICHGPLRGPRRRRGPFVQRAVTNYRRTTTSSMRSLLLRALIELRVALGIVETHVVFAALRLQRFTLESGGDHLALRDGETIVRARGDGGFLACLLRRGGEILRARLFAVALLVTLFFFPWAGRSRVRDRAVRLVLGARFSGEKADRSRKGTDQTEAQCPQPMTFHPFVFLEEFPPPAAVRRRRRL